MEMGALLHQSHLHSELQESSNGSSNRAWQERPLADHIDENL
jgi:hypothetical protein